MNLELALIAAFTIPAVIGTIVLAVRDGYRRVPSRRA